MPDIKLKFFTKLAPELASILIETDGKRILVDPGRDERKLKPHQVLPYYELKKLDAIIITHYHGDHSNLLDEILRDKKYRGPIICHSATAELIREYYDLEKFADQFIPLNYDQHFNFFENSVVSLYDAGHVLGSAIVYLQIAQQTLVITGDLGATFLPIVKPPTTIFPADKIDLLVIEAKQIHKEREVDTRINPLGDVLYCKLRDCFQFDDGNILIYSPLVQIPWLLYCLNYIFDNKEYNDIHRKISRVYLDPQPKVRKLLDIFNKYRGIFDRHEKERVSQNETPFDFDALEWKIPDYRTLRRSIFITPNRANFIDCYKELKSSDKNDVLLLNHNIHHALQGRINLIDEKSYIQIKRLPYLHYHPDINELSNWCNSVIENSGVNEIIFYHFDKKDSAAKMKDRVKIAKVHSVHDLNEGRFEI